jgi:hypothetical protein
MLERRVAPRRRVLKAGTIEFGGREIECTVRNVSSTGAVLDVGSRTGIPDQFTLALPSDGLHLRFPCRVIWRKESSIGVGHGPASAGGREQRNRVGHAWRGT